MVVELPGRTNSEAAIESGDCAILPRVLRWVFAAELAASIRGRRANCEFSALSGEWSRFGLVAEE